MNKNKVKMLLGICFTCLILGSVIYMTHKSKDDKPGGNDKDGIKKLSTSKDDNEEEVNIKEEEVNIKEEEVSIKEEKLVNDQVTDNLKCYTCVLTRESNDINMDIEDKVFNSQRVLENNTCLKEDSKEKEDVLKEEALLDQDFNEEDVNLTDNITTLKEDLPEKEINLPEKDINVKSKDIPENEEKIPESEEKLPEKTIDEDIPEKGTLKDINIKKENSDVDKLEINLSLKLEDIQNNSITPNKRKEASTDNNDINLKIIIENNEVKSIENLDPTYKEFKDDEKEMSSMDSDKEDPRLTLENKKSTTPNRKESTTPNRKESTTLNIKESTTLNRKKSTTPNSKESTTLNRKESKPLNRKECDLDDQKLIQLNYKNSLASNNLNTINHLKQCSDQSQNKMNTNNITNGKESNALVNCDSPNNSTPILPLNINYSVPNINYSVPNINYSVPMSKNTPISNNAFVLAPSMNYLSNPVIRNVPSRLYNPHTNLYKNIHYKQASNNNPLLIPRDLVDNTKGSHQNLKYINKDQEVILNKEGKAVVNQNESVEINNNLLGSGANILKDNKTKVGEEDIEFRNQLFTNTKKEISSEVFSSEVIDDELKNDEKDNEANNVVKNEEIKTGSKCIPNSLSMNNKQNIDLTLNNKKNIDLTLNNKQNIDPIYDKGRRIFGYSMKKSLRDSYMIKLHEINPLIDGPDLELLVYSINFLSKIDDSFLTDKIVIEVKKTKKLYADKVLMEAFVEIIKVLAEKEIPGNLESLYKTLSRELAYYNVIKGKHGIIFPVDDYEYNFMTMNDKFVRSLFDHVTNKGKENNLLYKTFKIKNKKKAKVSPLAYIVGRAFGTVYRNINNLNDTNTPE